jgi:hypothetical protein
MSERAALLLVARSEARLWSPEGAPSLSYLTGPERCLSAATIRAARLGATRWVAIPKADGAIFRAIGVVIPWFNAGRLALVKIRQPNDRRPKYVEAFRDPSRVFCYPGPERVRSGHTLVVAEGEFDALALGDALVDIAAVVTLGSASARPTPRALSAMLAAPRWLIASDGDDAGDRAMAGWPARARRIRPPEPYKDWTEAKGAGVNLARWWHDCLAGIEKPELFPSDELAT